MDYEPDLPAPRPRSSKIPAILGECEPGDKVMVRGFLVAVSGQMRKLGLTRCLHLTDSGYGQMACFDSAIPVEWP